MITIKSPLGGFVAIVPVTGGKNCPWQQRAYAYCGHPNASGDTSLREHQHSSSSMPCWCPAIAAAQDDLPGTADMDFLLKDAIASLQGEAHE